MATSRFCVPSLLLSLALGAGGMAVSQASAAEAPAAPAGKAEADKAGQPVAPDLSALPKATAKELPVDMAQFLAGGAESKLQDPVWRFSPNKILPKGAAGKSNRLVVMPVRVGKGGYRTGSPPVGIDDGRFIGWYLPVSDAKDAAAAAALPPGAPRVASGFAVTEDGRIHWTVDRFANTMDFASGGVVTDEKSFYLFNLDRPRFKALAVPPYKKGPAFVPPPKAGKSQSAEEYRAIVDAAKAAHAKQEADARKAYDLRKEQYAAAADRVGALPDKLSAPAPEVAYAVYYVPVPRAGSFAASKPPEIVFAGHPRGAWKPSAAAWASLEALAKGPPSSPEGRKVAEARFAAVAAEIEAGRAHPLALDAASVVLAIPGVLDELTAASSAYAVAGKVIDAGEPDVRGRVMRALVAAGNSAAKASLLARAVAVNDGGDGDRKMADQLRVSALRVLLRSKETDTDARRAEAVNNAWADPSAAPAAAVFAELNALASDRDAAKFGGPMTLARAKAMAPLFRFQDIADAKRRAQALAAVAGACDKELLAEVLVAEALFAGTGVAPLEALAAVEAAGPGKVPLHHAKHGFLPMLTHQDGAVREAAWRALVSCQVRPLVGVAAGEATPVEELAGIVARITDAALARKPAPAGLADFLAAHLPSHAAVRAAACVGMVRALGDGGDAAARQAMEALAKPRANFADALAAVDAETRWRAVVGCYAAKGQKTPLPAGLLLSAKESEGVARWFAAEFAKGNLPMASQFAELGKDKAQLMDWVMGQEPRLAQAAVAILTYQEGGDDAQAAQMSAVMLAQPYKLRAQMERKWEACRSDLFAARVKASAGEREVRLAVCRKGDKAWREGAPKQVALRWGEGALATGVPGVDLGMDADKKLLLLSDASLLDRLNPKMRHELELGGLSGPVMLAWNAPCWEARIRFDEDTEVLLRVAPVGWKTLPPVADFGEKK